MKLNNIYLEGFKSIDKLEFNFSNDRLILVRGENGSGKSNFLQSVVYLFTDEADVNLEDLINWNSKKCIVHGNFEIKGNIFDYKIEIKKSGKQIITERTLIINNEEPITGSSCISEMKKYINPELLLYSSISQQLSGTNILFEKPAPRLEKLKSLLGLDIVKDAVESFKEEIKENKKKIEILNSEIKILEQMEFNLEDEFEIEPIESTQAEFDILEKSVQDYKIKNDEYNKYLVEKESYNSKLNSLKEKKEQLETVQEKLKNVEDTIISEVDIVSDDEIQELKNRLDKLSTDFTERKLLLNDIEKNTQLLTQKKDELEFCNILQEPTCSVTEEVINEKYKYIMGIENKVSELQNDLSLAGEGVCSKCGQEVCLDKEKIEEDINTQNNLLNRAKVSHNNMKLEYDKYKVELKAYESSQLKKSSVESEILNLQNSIETSKNNLPDEVSQDEIEKLKTEIKNLEDLKLKYSEYKIKIENKNNQVKELSENINTLESFINRTETNIVEPIFIEKPIEPDLVKFEELKKIIHQYEGKVQELDRIKNSNEAIKKKEEETKKSIAEKRLSIDDFSNENELRDQSIKILDKQYSAYLIEKGMTFIEARMNEFFQKTYKKYSVFLRQEKNSVNFFYSEDGEKMNPVSGACGSEKEILAEAFRVALSKIHNLGFFILDEVDTATSDTMSLSLYSNLMNIEYEQLFCVTHRQSTQEYLENNFNARVIQF